MRNHSRRLLPPMGALQCFEAASRHDNFSRAAEEVGLTQGAVSRQIGMLEDWLQIELFERLGRRVKLTRAGRDYANAVIAPLARIRAATAQALDHMDGRQLTIATLPGFGMRWLAPRLSGYSECHPDVVVNITARSNPFDLAASGFDAAIHYGLPDWPQAIHRLLFRETVTPVVSPFLRKQKGLATAKDLLSIPLLSQHSRRQAWSRWFTAAGVEMREPLNGPVYDQFLMLAQAVIAGAGAALIPTFLIEPELASGALVIPFDLTLSGEEAYYFVRDERSGGEPLHSFEEWIVQQATGPFADHKGGLLDNLLITG